MKSSVRVNCWHGHGHVLMSWTSASTPWEMGKAFLWSKFECWQYVQVQISIKDWPVGVKSSQKKKKSSNCCVLLLLQDVYSLILRANRHLLPRLGNSSPCAVHNKCTPEGQGCVVVGATPSECAVHFTPTFLFLCLSLSFLHSLIASSQVSKHQAV